jgi:hypothetical protein
VAWVVLAETVVQFIVIDVIELSKKCQRWGRAPKDWPRGQVLFDRAIPKDRSTVDKETTTRRVVVVGYTSIRSPATMSMARYVRWDEDGRRICFFAE